MRDFTVVQFVEQLDSTAAHLLCARRELDQHVINYAQHVALLAAWRQAVVHGSHAR